MAQACPVPFSCFCHHWHLVTEGGSELGFWPCLCYVRFPHTHYPETDGEGLAHCLSPGVHLLQNHPPLQEPAVGWSTSSRLQRKQQVPRAPALKGLASQNKPFTKNLVPISKSALYCLGLKILPAGAGQCFTKAAPPTHGPKRLCSHCQEQIHNSSQFRNIGNSRHSWGS